MQMRFAPLFAALALVSSTHLSAQSSLTLPQGAVVDITERRGNVEVRGWDRSEVMLSGNNSHEVVQTSSGAQVRRIRGRDSDATLRVNVPRTSRILVNAASNDIDVRDIESDVEVRSNSGDVTMNRIGGRVRITSIASDIRLSGIANGARVSTISGDVEMIDARGDIQVGTTGGDISIGASRVSSLQLETMNGEVQFAGSIADGARSSVSTHNGDVRLELAADARAMIVMRSFRGRVTSQIPLTLLPSEERKQGDAAYRLQLGREGGPSLAITTFGGDIDLVRARARDNN
jgi:hypothetical protein